MKSVLYVEDNKDTAEAVKMILERSGYSVALRYTGKEGLEEARKDIYDVLLLDIMLPDMSGWDILAEINGKVRGKIAFLSALPVSSERIEELKKSGVSDYIMKPFAKNDLIARVKRLVV